MPARTAVVSGRVSLEDRKAIVAAAKRRKESLASFVARVVVTAAKRATRKPAKPASRNGEAKSAPEGLRQRAVGAEPNLPRDAQEATGNVQAEPAASP